MQVRWQDTPSQWASVGYVGIGDVYVIAGQSNASGRGTNLQSYSHSWLKAGLFGNDYKWKELADATDDGTGQIDNVSADGLGGTFGAYGSYWPLLATQMMAARGVPVAFIPTSKGGTSILGNSTPDWHIPTTHTDRTTLYGSMIYRAQQMPNGVRAVLWHQGEQDMGTAAAGTGMAQATYSANLTALANAVYADIGAPLIPAKLQVCSAVNSANEALINNAIGAAWGTGHIVTGPDLSALTDDGDGFHLKTDGKLQSAADLWWSALSGAGY